MNEFFEKTLEEIVFDKRETIHEKGLDIFYKHAERQVCLRGKRIDILTWEIVDNVIFARIIEFKREKLNEAALFQAAEYYIDFILCTMSNFKDYKVEIVLIGTESCKNIGLITPLTNLIKVYEYHFGFDGISFKPASPDADCVNENFHEFSLGQQGKDFSDKLKNIGKSDN